MFYNPELSYKYKTDELWIMSPAEIQAQMLAANYVRNIPGRLNATERRAH